MCSTNTRRLVERVSEGKVASSGLGVGGYGEYGERKSGVECVDDAAVLVSSNPRPERVALCVVGVASSTGSVCTPTELERSLSGRRCVVATGEETSVAEGRGGKYPSFESGETGGRNDGVRESRFTRRDVGGLDEVDESRSCVGVGSSSPSEDSAMEDTPCEGSAGFWRGNRGTYLCATVDETRSIDTACPPSHGSFPVFSVG